jgi:hypothetical protein
LGHHTHPVKPREKPLQLQCQASKYATNRRKAVHLLDLPAFRCGGTEGDRVSEAENGKSLSLLLGKLVPTAEVGSTHGRAPEPEHDAIDRLCETGASGLMAAIVPVEGDTAERTLEFVTSRL